MMKKSLYTIAFTLSLALSVHGQIGINTETPQQFFHIDSNKNTSGNTNTIDDIVIDKKGNIGIGTISPTAKVDIKDETVTPLLKLADGTEGLGKILYSKDANGNISWLDPSPSWAKVFNTYTGKRNLANTAQSLLFATKIEVTGNYFIALRWWGRATVALTSGISAYIHLSEATGSSISSSSTSKDGIEYYIPYPVANAPFSFTATFFGYFTAGRWLQIRMNPATPIDKKYNWVIGQDGNSIALNPSVIVYKL